MIKTKISNNIIDIIYLYDDFYLKKKDALRFGTISVPLRSIYLSSHTHMDIQEMNAGAEKVIQHLKESFAHLQLGRATTSLVEHMQIYVPSRGSTTGLNSLANVSIMDAQTIKIEPYSKNELKIIEKGIIESNLGFNPLNQGDYIMIKVPALTTERRQELTKIVHKEGEDAKVALRNLRQESRNTIEKQFKAKEISENEKNATEKNIDEMTKKYNEKIEELVKAKSEEVMKV